MKAAAIATAVAVSRIAGADPAPPADPKPDPAAARAADANLESIEHRRGIVFGAALGPSVTIGGGTGTGGDLSIKIGHVATPSTVITMVIGGSAQLHKIGSDGELVPNNLTYALVGMQYWAGPSLWIGLGGGGGSYHCNECIDDTGRSRTRKWAGVGTSFGAGVDLIRYRNTVVGTEVYSVGLLTRDGFIATFGLALDSTFD